MRPHLPYFLPRWAWVASDKDMKAWPWYTGVEEPEGWAVDEAREGWEGGGGGSESEGRKQWGEGLRRSCVGL